MLGFTVTILMSFLFPKLIIDAETMQILLIQQEELNVVEGLILWAFILSFAFYFFKGRRKKGTPEEEEKRIRKIDEQIDEEIRKAIEDWDKERAEQRERMKKP